MHTFVASTCMHVVHSDGFRFDDGFEYTYLNSQRKYQDSPSESVAM
jgi:hypothetical protein